MKTIVAEYHIISDASEIQRLPHTGSAAFAQHLQMARRRKLSSMNLKQGDRFNHLNKNWFVPTFDDSLKPTLQSALEVLDRYEYQGIFFVYTNVLNGEKKWPVLEKQRILQYLGDSYRDFLDDFCRCVLRTFPELSQHLFSNSKSVINDIGSTYLNEWSFYSNEERYFRYLRDKCLSKGQMEMVVNGMFNDRYDAERQDDLFDLFFLNKSDLVDIVNAGHIIGCHTHTHPFDLRALNEVQVRFELETSKAILEDGISNTVNLLAYPNGYYNDAVIDIVKEVGFSEAFTTGGGTQFADQFALPRCDSALIEEVLS